MIYTDTFLSKYIYFCTEKRFQSKNIKKNMSEKDEKIRAEVFTVAQKLFQKYGFSKTTMEDIAKAMGRGKSTLYYYYKSKEEIFDEVIIREAKEIQHKTREAVEAVPSAEEKIAAYIQTSYNSARERILFYRVMKEDLFNMDADFIFQTKTFRKVVFDQLNAQELEYIKGIIQYGIDRKEFTSETLKIIDTTAYIIISTIRSIAFSIAMDLTNEVESPDHVEDKLDVLIHLLIKGLK